MVSSDINEKFGDIREVSVLNILETLVSVDIVVSSVINEAFGDICEVSTVKILDIRFGGHQRSEVNLESGLSGDMRRQEISGR